MLLLFFVPFVLFVVSRHYILPKFSSILSPMAWLFSGWNWVATTFSFQREAQNSMP